MIDSLSEKLSHPAADKSFNLASICKCSYAKVLLREYAETATGGVLYQKMFLEI